MRVTSLFGWFGGKANMSKFIIEKMPPHTIYAEPFAGSAAVFFRKNKCEENYLNDLYPELIDLYQVLQDKEKNSELKRLMRLTPHSQAEFVFCKENFNDPSISEIEKARRWLTFQVQGFSGGGFGNRSWGYARTKVTLPTRKFVRNNGDIFDFYCEMLSGVNLSNIDGTQFIRDFGYKKNALIYLDPPYVLDARKFSGKFYKYEMLDSAHREFLTVIQNSPCMIMLSGYDSPIYNEQLSDWKKFTKDVPCHSVPKVRHTRFGSDKAKERTGILDDQRRTEVLWLNEPAYSSVLSLTLF